MKYTSIRLFEKMVKHALSEGLQAGDFKGLSTPISDIDHLQAVPANHFFELHELLDEKLGPGFSVRVGQEMKMEDYGVLGLAWKTCSQAKEIFERSERYFKLLSNTYLFKVEEEGALSKIHLLRKAYRRGVGLSNEATFSATVVVLQMMTDTQITPQVVSFEHSPPSDDKDYKKVFKCPVLFEQASNFIAYKTIDLETHTIKADKSINAYLLERVDEETKGVEISGSKIVEQVKTLIEDALPSGIPAISAIGKHIGMSSRTLTRRLSESGTNFRDLIKQTQEEIALQLLKNKANSIGEIAFLTGFSEQSAFNRAFKRWTGLSPSEYRKKQ